MPGRTTSISSADWCNFARSRSARSSPSSGAKAGPLRPLPPWPHPVGSWPRVPSSAGRPGSNAARDAGAGDNAAGTSLSKPYHATGVRVHAARLVAGEYSVAGFTGRVGIKDPVYRAIETGRRPLNGVMLAKVATCLGVSPGFVGSGVPETAIDLRAGECALRLLRHQSTGFAGNLAGRLTSIRRQRGFLSASAAAAHYGWSIGRYCDHESRRRNIGLDQAVRYGAAFQALDSLLFDDPSSPELNGGRRADAPAT